MDIRIKSRGRKGATLFVCLILFFGFGLFGCRSQDSPEEEIMVQGETKWFSLRDLRAYADAHVQKEGANLDQNRFVITTGIYRCDETNMVTFQYWRDFGRPAYFITFDRFGAVANYKTAIASEITD